MSKLSRRIERGFAKRKAKDLHTGADAVRRLVAGTEGLTSISQAISLLQEIGPAMEECRNAALLAVQHAVALERMLDKERFIRQQVTQMIADRLPTSFDVGDMEKHAEAVWDKANPAPPLEGADAAAGGA